MALPQGVNFRETSGYVSDGTDDYAQISATVNYPTTTPQGNNVGWLTAGAWAARNRNASNPASLAGVHYATTSVLAEYRIDLPAAGTYSIRFAGGDASASARVHCQIYDGTTTLLATIGPSTTGAANRFVDASGVVRLSPAAWVSDNVAIELTFSTSTLLLRFPADSGAHRVIAHIAVYPVGGGDLTVITGLATETNSAFAVTRRKIRSIALSTETDTAFSVSGGAAPVTVVTGLATESDNAFSIARTKIRSVSLSLEVDSAFNVTRRKVRSVALTAETDTALAITRIKRRLTDLAQESDTALSLESGSITVVTGLASESDSAFAVNRRKLRTISLSLESDSALAVRAQRWKSIGLGLETDTAFNVSILPHVLIGQAEESDSALPMAALSYTLVGMAVETNTAFPLVKVAIVLPRYEVLRYTPQNIPEISDENIRKVFTYVLDEYARLANMLDLLAKGHVELTFKAPNKPYEGMTRLADGTYWNPGSGKGVYVYFDGTWNKVS